MIGLFHFVNLVKVYTKIEIRKVWRCVELNDIVIEILSDVVGFIPTILKEGGGTYYRME